MAELTSLKRSAAQLGLVAERKLQALMDLMGEISIESPELVSLAKAESQINNLNGSLEKLCATVFQLHDLYGYDPDDDKIMKEKYYLMFSKIQERSLDIQSNIIMARGIYDEKIRMADSKAIRDAKIKSIHNRAGDDQNYLGVRDTRDAGQKRCDNTLKPDALELESSLDDFKHWRKQFEAFYQTNHMDHMPIAEQRAHLEACMSKKVTNTIVHLLEIKDDVPIIDILNALQKYI